VGKGKKKKKKKKQAWGGEKVTIKAKLGTQKGMISLRTWDENMEG